MRIMFFLQGGIIGGAETQLLTLCRELKKKKVETWVATSASNLFDSFYQKLKKETQLLQTLSYQELAQAIDREKPDILQHFHNHMVSVALDHAEHHPQVVEVVHGCIHFPNDITTTPKHHTTRVVAVSQDAADFFTQALPEWSGRTLIIPNGVDTSVFLPPNEPQRMGPVKILHVGRLYDGDKKYFEMINACMELRVPWYLQLVGTGVDQQKIFAYAASHCPGRVQFFGFRENPAPIYAQADIYISRSESEGFGLSIAEAASCALPIVMWDCGGIARLFDKKGAWIASNTAQFKEGLRELSEKPELREELGQAARDVICTRASAELMADTYIRLYKDLAPANSTHIVLRETRHLVGMSNPNFSGVTHAVQAWVGKKNWVGAMSSSDPIAQDLRTRLGNKPATLIIGGDAGYLPIVEYIKQKCPRTKIIMTWHASLAFNAFAPRDALLLAEWVKRVHSGLIDRLAFVRPKAHEVFRHERIIHFPDAVPEQALRKSKAGLGRGYHVGVFGSGYPWKNVQQTVLAASLIPQSVIHTHPHDDPLYELAGVKLRQHNRLDHLGFINLLKNMDLNIQGSFTESFGLLFCESWRQGVPCIGSPVFRPLVGDTESLGACFLEDPDDVTEIACKAETIRASEGDYIYRMNRALDRLEKKNAAIRTQVLEQLWSEP